MKKLAPPDLFHLQAAEGWMELGNYTEAGVEWKKLSPANHSHPWALEVRWRLRCAAGQHDECLAIANTLVELAPKSPFGWIHRSYSLHELKRTQEAYDNLMPAVRKFPKDCIIPYNLACYCCQLGQPEKAMEWLTRARTYGDSKKIKQMALSDKDLEPLWSIIAKLL